MEAILEELRPNVEARVRRRVTRAVDVPDSEEFRATEFEFRSRPASTRRINVRVDQASAQDHRPMAAHQGFKNRLVALRGGMAD
jgi:hypothetical protein